MFAIGENYDVGDMLASVPTTFGIGSVSGLATGSLFGIALTDQALALGSYSVSFAVLFVILGTLTSYVTNDGLTVDSLLTRPNWEKVAVALTVLIPVLSVISVDVATWMTASYVNGALAAIPMLIGYLIVGFRRGNSKKEGLFSKVSVGN